MSDAEEGGEEDIFGVVNEELDSPPPGVGDIVRCGEGDGEDAIDIFRGGRGGGGGEIGRGGVSGEGDAMIC